MSPPPFDVQKAHRWFAVELNNHTWNLLEKTDRTADESEQMVHAAHASCYHWLQVGTVANYARGIYLVAHAHAAIGDGATSIRYAEQCIDIMKKNPEAMADWDYAFAYDSLARGHAAEGNTNDANRIHAEAREYGDRIADPDDKKIFDQWFDR